MKSQASFSSLFFLLLYLLCSSSVYAFSLWDVQSDETIITAQYKGMEEEGIVLETENGRRTFAKAPGLIMAISGRQTGQMLAPDEYPEDIQVEAVLNSRGEVRAVKNIRLSEIRPKGLKLPSSGHDLTWSPDGNHYLLYHHQEGLSLHSLEKELLSHLSTWPAAAWNNTGTKFACSYGQDLIIYNLCDLDKPEIIRLPLLPRDITRVITGLEWSPDDEKLFYSCLEDYADQGSEIFRIAILDSTGREHASTIISNLGYAGWADDNSLLLGHYSDFASTSGRLIRWYPATDRISQLLPWSRGIGPEFAYNRETQVMAFTLKKQKGTEIRFIDLEGTAVTDKSYLLPYPPRNLQWSAEKSLCYWDEINELIWEIQDPLTQSSVAKPLVTGYLPPKGVQKGFLYFTSEPQDKPLHPYFYLPLQLE